VDKIVKTLVSVRKWGLWTVVRDSGTSRLPNWNVPEIWSLGWRSVTGPLCPVCLRLGSLEPSVPSDSDPGEFR